jgi:predicted O-linked N-acetylglucosamine transferase (SPINDLY family)
MNRHRRRAAGKQGQPPHNPAAASSPAIVPPDVAEFLADGVAHHRAGRLPQAETCYRQVLAVQPDHAEALHLMGVIAQQMGRHDVAVELIGRAIERNRNSPSYFCNLGNALRETGRLEEAVAACHHAIRMQPHFAEAYSNLSLALRAQGKFDEAIAACRNAIRLKPTLAEAHYNLGNALRELGKVDEAIAAYREALRIDPGSPKAHCNLAAGLADRGNFDEAVAAFREAIRLKPDFVDASSTLLLCMNYGERFSPAALLEAHRAWGERHGRPPAQAAAYSNERSAGRRLKVGYVSPDFRQHSVAYFLEPLLRSHDHNEIEVFCYAEVGWPDALTRQFKQLADHWFSTVGISDEALAQRIRQDGIDILVDLAGHTSKNRLMAFARKPAPIQATWLGYPNTTGLEAIDYRLVDAVTDPESEADAWASETLVRLPGGFLCFAPPADAPAPGPPPSLTAGVVTFGSFNNSTKLSAVTLDAWAQVLARLPRARLLLKAKSFGDAATCAAYLDRLNRLGVAAAQVEFTAWMPNQAHLALYNRIDIALDPFPYNGTTTTCEALWMGVPVVTLRGDRHSGRVGASLLTQVDMIDLIADSVEAYVEIAVALAADPARLSGLRLSLRPHMAASPLCDAPAFARKVEAAYRAMWRRWCVESLQA